MRVIAGTARSLKLKTPQGLETRPTTDRIKETLFNMIQMKVAGSVFLDLFCGSGSIGIEALSRGAAKAYFVDNDRAAFDCLSENVKHTQMEDRAVLLRQDVSGALSAISEKKADIIFMDPPYQLEYEQKTLRLLWDMPFVAQDTMIIVEALLETDFSFAQSCGYLISREKNYKTNKHVFLTKK